MLLNDLLTKSSDQAAVRNLAGSYGLDEQTTHRLVESVVTHISEAVEKNTLSRGGIADLVDLIGTHDYKNYLGENTPLKTTETEAAGIDALAHLFRTKQKSRIVAAAAARETGVPEDAIASMLPQIAAISLGALTRQLEDKLGTLAQAAHEKTGKKTQGIVASSSTRFAPQEPLSLPGDDMIRSGPSSRPSGNPYGDLSDIIRKRRGRIDGQKPGNILRDLLGGLLGFKNKGVISWIIQLLIARYGWRIFQFIFGKLLLGR